VLHQKGKTRDSEDAHWIRSLDLQMLLELSVLLYSIQGRERGRHRLDHRVVEERV